MSQSMPLPEFLAALGQRLAQHRIDRGLTQAALAREAGTSKRTVERLEAGESVQLNTLLRVLRVLDLLHALAQAIPDLPPRPLDLLQARGHRRRRASSQSDESEANRPWTWDDES